MSEDPGTYAPAAATWPNPATHSVYVHDAIQRSLLETMMGATKIECIRALLPPGRMHALGGFILLNIGHTLIERDETPELVKLRVEMSRMRLRREDCPQCSITQDSPCGLCGGHRYVYVKDGDQQEV